MSEEALNITLVTLLRKLNELELDMNKKEIVGNLWETQLWSNTVLELQKLVLSHVHQFFKHNKNSFKLIGVQVKKIKKRYNKKKGFFFFNFCFKCFIKKLSFLVNKWMRFFWYSLTKPSSMMTSRQSHNSSSQRLKIN